MKFRKQLIPDSPRVPKAYLLERDNRQSLIIRLTGNRWLEINDRISHGYVLLTGSQVDNILTSYPKKETFYEGDTLNITF